MPYACTYSRYFELAMGLSEIEEIKKWESFVWINLSYEESNPLVCQSAEKCVPLRRSWGCSNQQLLCFSIKKPALSLWFVFCCRNCCCQWVRWLFSFVVNKKKRTFTQPAKKSVTVASYMLLRLFVSIKDVNRKPKEKKDVFNQTNLKSD